MLLKDEVYDDGCPTCGRGKELSKAAVYGCDKCKKEITSPHDVQCDYLEMTVFYSDDRDAKHFHFCSWDCVFNFLKTIQRTKHKSNYFINLPHIMFDGSKPDYKDFINTIKKMSIQ